MLFTSYLKLLPGVLMFTTLLAPSASWGQADAAKTAAQGVNTFGMRLLQAVARQQPGKNVFLSPTSLSQALGMAYSGADGATKGQMATVLGLPGGTPSANKQQAALLSSLLKPAPKVTLRVANAIWSSNQFPFRPSFAQSGKTYYQAQAHSLNMKQPTAAATINRWVSAATQGKIATLVTPASIRNSSAVLTNAVYFKGTWQNTFSKEETRPQPFTPQSGTTFDIPMMHRTGGYALHTGANFDLVSLPYGTGRWSFIAVLPHKGTMLATVIGQMNAAALNKALESAKYQRLALGVPRFRMTYSETMNTPLQILGMTRAFSDNAEFGPMFARGTHRIDAVVHKTVLEVNETGSEATAATGVIMAPTSAIITPPRPFVLDRPFLCFIRDSETGAVAFAGAVYRPEVLNQ